MKATRTKSSLDWILISSYLSLVTIGWFMIYSTVYDPEVPLQFLDVRTPIGSQTLWIAISLIIFIVVLTLDWKFWNTFAVPIYVISLLFLVLVLIFGTVINGAKAWFDFGFFSFQPSEWAKLGTALALASYLSFNKKNYLDSNTLWTAIGVFMIPALLILLQPDAGSAMVFFSFFILMFRKGMSYWFYLTAIGLVTIFITSLVFSPLLVTLVAFMLGISVLMYDQLPVGKASGYILALLAVSVFLYVNNEHKLALIPFGGGFIVYSIFLTYNRNFKIPFIMSSLLVVAIGLAFFSEFVIDNVLKPHQQERINVWLRPERCDPRGSLYNIIQSKLAIGSGGFAGKGYLKGEMTKLNYVPEQSTDSIFTCIAEEQGFVGSIGIVILFTIIILRCFAIAEKTRLEFIKGFCYSVGGIIFFHFIINLGMAMGLLPVVGIPLPFLSKGGSSLVMFTVLIGIVIKMNQNKMTIA
ncbi:MAG: rod shape-determining protein RodA [Saprospiraceae bacterium]|nr:rod shape-determining protein RodA [Saprospiraceae bacterium]